MSRRNSRNNKREVEEPKFRVNGTIRVPEIRLVGNNLADISEKIGTAIESGVYPTKKVMAWATKVDQDLVEISPKAKPPVCRIVDYSKFLYERKKKEKEIKSKAVKTVIKEIRFGPNTDDHDFEFKTRHAISFLEDGAKVKAYVQFKGRTIVFKERGELLLLKFMSELEAFGAAEAMPRLEGRRMSVMISPKKSKKNLKPKPKKRPPLVAKKKPTPKPEVVKEEVVKEEVAPTVEVKATQEAPKVEAKATQEAPKVAEAPTEK